MTPICICPIDRKLNDGSVLHAFQLVDDRDGFLIHTTDWCATVREARTMAYASLVDGEKIVGERE